MGARYDPGGVAFQNRLYEEYEELRAAGAVVPAAPAGWAVVRHEAARQALGNWGTFSSRTPAVPQPAGHLAVQDPPRHTALRRLVSRVFTPSQMEALRAPVAEQAARLVAEADADGTFDLVAGVARPLPERVFAHLLGYPDDDLPRLRRLLDDFLQALAVQAGGGPMDDGPRKRVHQALAEVVAVRRAAPADDLLSLLLRAEVDGETLTEEEVLGFCFNLVLAANETTTNLVANGVSLLYQHTAQLDRLRHEPELLPAAVEEILRYESPVQALHRTVTADTHLGGVDLPAGAHLKIVYGSANRDERVFAHAARFDIGRVDQRHLAFGFGIHFCLGAQLARVEGVEALRALLPVLPGRRPVRRDRQWKRSSWQRSLVALPLERRS